MNRRDAKAILEMYRSGGQDAHDPHFAEALEFARKDAELGQWFAAQQTFDAAMAASLKAVSVPPELKASILAQCRPAAAPAQQGWKQFAVPASAVSSPYFKRWLTAMGSVLTMPVLPGRKILLSPVWRHWQARTALAVSLGLVAVVAGLWLTRKPQNFARYRAEVVDRAWDSERHLDIATSDLTQVRQWLTRQNADGDFVLPPALANAHVQGCRVLAWHGHKVSFICLLDGPKHLHLFVTDRRDLPDAPPPGAPLFEKCERWQTASWTQGHSTYVLSGMKYTTFVKRFRKGGQWLFAGQKASAASAHSHS